ncbi:MAG: sugar ABC transporter permease [Clostridia bacterium]|nr:sugar ABC transporter permease [Clostridia bacterium]
MPYLFLVLPAFIYEIIFWLLPLGGVVIAFKDFNYRDGIFGSPWVGFKYFDYFFTSQDAVRTIRNTILYSVWFHVVGIIAGVFLAILLYEVSNRKLLRVYHTTLLAPYFISWVVVAYVFNILLGYSYGVLNQMITACGGTAVQWYSEPAYWPVILTIAALWKNIGMGCVFYYANLMSLDENLFEAAAIDGAGRIRQWIHIGIPSLIPLICILTIMKMGSIMGGDFGLFYQVSMNNGALYPATDILSTYIYRGLVSGGLSATAAVGLFQSVVGFIMVVLSNSVVKRLDPDSAMF